MNISPHSIERQAMGDPLASNQTQFKPNHGAGKHSARHAQTKWKKKVKNAGSDGSRKTPSSAHLSSSKHGMRWSYLQLIKDGLIYLTTKRTRGAVANSSSRCLVDVAASRKRGRPSRAAQARRRPGQFSKRPTKHSCCKRPAGRSSRPAKPHPRKNVPVRRGGGGGKGGGKGCGRQRTRWVMAGFRNRATKAKGATRAGGQKVRPRPGNRAGGRCANKGRGRPRTIQRGVIKKGATRQPSKRPKPGQPQRRNPSRLAKTKGKALLAKLRQAMRAITKGPSGRAQVRTKGLAPGRGRQVCKQRAGRKPAATRPRGPGRPRKCDPPSSRDPRSGHKKSHDKERRETSQTSPSRPSTSTHPKPTPVVHKVTRKLRSPSRGARSPGRVAQSHDPGFTIVTRSMSRRSLDQS